MRNGNLGYFRSRDRTHQFEYRPRIVPSSSMRRAETTMVFGTSLSFVRCGWHGKTPFQSSVLAFGASTTAFSSWCAKVSSFRSKHFMSSFAFFSSSELFVPHISTMVSIVKCATESAEAGVFFSLRVIPTVYGRNSRLMVKYAGLGRRK